MQNYEKYDYNANFFIKLVELSYKSINLSHNTKVNRLRQKMRYRGVDLNLKL